jgi:hypothetical protein
MLSYKEELSVSVTVSQSAQMQIHNSLQRNGELQAELNRIAASLNMSDQLYQFLSHVLSNVGCLATGCDNLVNDLRRSH